MLELLLLIIQNTQNLLFNKIQTLKNKINDILNTLKTKNQQICLSTRNKHSSYLYKTRDDVQILGCNSWIENYLTLIPPPHTIIYLIKNVTRDYFLLINFIFRWSVISLLVEQETHEGDITWFESTIDMLPNTSLKLTKCIILR